MAVLALLAAGRAQAHDLPSAGRLCCNQADLVDNAAHLRCDYVFDNTSIPWAGIEWNYGHGYPWFWMDLTNGCRTVLPADAWIQVTDCFCRYVELSGWVYNYGSRLDGTWGQCGPGPLYCPTIDQSLVTLNMLYLSKGSLQHHQTMVHELGHTWAFADINTQCNSVPSIMNYQCHWAGYHAPLSHDLYDIDVKY